MSDETFPHEPSDLELPLPTPLGAIGEPAWTQPDDPTWYIKAAVHPDTEQGEWTARTADPVVLVEYPTGTTSSFVVLAIIFAALIAPPVWSISSFHKVPGTSMVTNLVICLFLIALMVWGIVGAILQIIVNVPLYYAIGSAGITLWRKNTRVDVDWEDIRRIGVHIKSGTVYYFQTRKTAATDRRIRLTLSPERLSTVSRSKRAVLLRTTAMTRFAESEPFNAVIPLASVSPRRSASPSSAVLADIALSRFAHGAYESIVRD